MTQMMKVTTMFKPKIIFSELLWVVLFIACIWQKDIFGDDKKKIPCPQIDQNVKDPDGMPLCPEQVKEQSAWAVYRCAVEQARSFHDATKDEKANMSILLEGWQAGNTADVLAAADKLHLQACRVKQTRDGKPDSFLLVYVKPKITDYSGPFMMLRETKHSKVLIIGPHDDSDGTYADTKLATSETFAMGTISNGHKRGNVRKPGMGRTDDFVHSDGPEQNLGTFVVKKICDMNKTSVVLHVHGMKDNTKVLYRDRENNVFGNAYEKAIKKYTNINQFAPLNAYFSIDPIVNTNWYIKTEIPARIHVNNKRALMNIVRELETYDWAWSK